MADSLAKLIFQRPAFASHSPAWALAAGLSRQDLVYITTDESFRLHNDEFDEMPCKQDVIENLRPFEKYPIPPQTTTKHNMS